MTLSKFFGFSVLQFVLLFLLKLWVFDHQIFTNAGFQEIFFWVATAVIIAAIVRRFGVMNFLEAFFLIFCWVLGNLFLDLLLTSKYTGLEIFSQSSYWFGYLALGLAILFFHKKRHIHIRNEMHAKANAAAHPSEHKH